MPLYPLRRDIPDQHVRAREVQPDRPGYHARDQEREHRPQEKVL